jgi:hypothetical protein
LLQSGIGNKVLVGFDLSSGNIAFARLDRKALPLCGVVACPPSRREHRASLCQTRHHDAHRNAGHFGYFPIRHAVAVAQNQDFAQVRGQRAEKLRNACFPLNTLGRTRTRFALTLPGEIRMANAPEDSEQPRLDSRAAPAIGTVQRETKAFLDGVLCFRSILQQEIGQPVGVIETWQRGLAKSLDTAGYSVAMVAHHNFADRFT